MNIINHQIQSAWISIRKPNPSARIRLFCFPYSGAAASIFFPWSDILPESIEVCAIQYPGRGTRIAEPLIEQLDELVTTSFSEIEKLLDRPFAFFGHSLGALFSFELARLIRNFDIRQPSHLFVSGHGSPHLPDPNPHLHHLPDLEFKAKLRELNGMTSDILENKELMDLLVPIIRADFKVCETYQYHDQPELSIPISAFGGLSDPYVSRSDLEAWQEQTLSKCTVKMFPGDHFYLNTARMLLIQVVAKELSAFII
jgi:medium-chain acyl-[acyl-carrier-protein] hydrolase